MFFQLYPDADGGENSKDFFSQVECTGKHEAYCMMIFMASRCKNSF